MPCSPVRRVTTHTAVTAADKGELYVWGANGEGQLGLGNDKPVHAATDSYQHTHPCQCPTPRLLKMKPKVRLVSLGYTHTALVNGRLAEVPSLRHTPA